MGSWESTYHLMVVAVGDVCFLEKSTESSLKGRKKKKRKDDVTTSMQTGHPLACRLGTHLIPPHYWTPKTVKALGGLEGTAAPCPQAGTCACHLLTPGQVVTTCIWDHHLCKKQLQQETAGVSQFTMMLCNHCVLGNKGNQTQPQKEPVKGRSSIGHDHSPHIPTRRSPGQGLQQVPTPYARTFPMQLQTEHGDD